MAEQQKKLLSRNFRMLPIMSCQHSQLKPAHSAQNQRRQCPGTFCWDTIVQKQAFNEREPVRDHSFEKPSIQGSSWCGTVDCFRANAAVPCLLMG